MSIKIGTIVLAAAALTACISACAASKSASATPSVAPSATTAADPVQACLQLHDFELHNTGQGVSAAFGRQLLEETQGTQLGTDIAQWLQDLGVNPSQFSTSGPGPLESYLDQTESDAATVAADCATYGVRNTLPAGD
jgi:hypothetical protein